MILAIENVQTPAIDGFLLASILTVNITASFYDEEKVSLLPKLDIYFLAPPTEILCLFTISLQ